MVNNASWLLPEGVEEILPQDAVKLEMLRRSILDDLQARDFQLVMPPVMEFVDSLLTGTGKDLDTQTYKFMDPNTQRMLGIRADMTPQIARIDAHYLSENDINRLCYAGTVLQTKPDQMGGQRELLQIGAELFGIEEQTGDIEVVDAMLSALFLAKLPQITLSLGHVGLYRSLLKSEQIPDRLEPILFDILLRKSLPDLLELGDQCRIEGFQSLLSLQGDVSILEKARKLLPKDEGIAKSLKELEIIVTHLQESHSQVNLHIDLSDVFGYRYHTGLKFYAYIDGRGRTVAKGGRYDRIGEQFGRARPATGFSADLKSLIKLSVS
ncbi:MAG: ATP phosphoribosyltransferase regulatory subunit [Acidiferrobacterales bacterium]|nr:ATP phosphoribosyltransferase regulatory subunit [Acidiferrobacterales bacterium]